MRLVDFLTDLRDTSSRIAERGAFAYNNVDLCAALTIKTLMRRDVIDYFDSLLAQQNLHLSPSRALIYYIYLYALAVNQRPQAHGSVLPLSARGAWRLLQNLDLKGGTCILSKPARLTLPGFLARKLGRILDQETTTGLSCAYLVRAPTPQEIKDVENSKTATLLIYPSSAGISGEIVRRAIYCGRIFTAPSLCLDAFYLGAES